MSQRADVLDTATEPPKGRNDSRLGRGYRTVQNIAEATAIALILWSAIALLAPDIPSPWGVGAAWIDSLGDVDIYQQMLVTGRRVLLGWLISLALGSLIALGIARSKLIDGILKPWYAIALALPGEVVVLFAVLIVGVRETSALLALVIATTPFVINIMVGGVRSLDENLIRMGQVYGFDRFQIVREIVVPHVAPFTLSASRVAFALSWKGVLSIEIFSRPDGVGKELQLFFRLLQAERVIAWSLTFMVVMVLIDWICHIKPAERVFAWRLTE